MVLDKGFGALTIGADGALYVGDDKRGRIWRITYHGSRAATLTAAATPTTGASPAPATTPATGGDTAKIALGRRLYNGDIAGASCADCHDADGEETPVGPSLVDAECLSSKGELPDIHHVIKVGVPGPKKSPAPMPPMGGVELSEPQIDAIAAYISAAAKQPKQRLALSSCMYIDQYLGFGEAVEEFAVEQFVAKLPVYIHSPMAIPELCRAP